MDRLIFRASKPLGWSKSNLRLKIFFFFSESTRTLRGEKSSRQSYQRFAKGNVSILETSSEGKYIVLENTHRSKEEPIGEWKLRRRIDGRREIVYTFPRDFVLRPGKTVKVKI